MQADGWTDIEEELEHAGFVIAARAFSAFVIVLGNFIFTQTIVAIILLNIDSATERFKASSDHSVLSNVNCLYKKTTRHTWNQTFRRKYRLTLEGGQTVNNLVIK